MMFLRIVPLFLHFILSLPRLIKEEPGIEVDNGNASGGSRFFTNYASLMFR